MGSISFIGALKGCYLVYVTIEDRLLEALRMKWQYAKMSKIEYYIENIMPQC